LSFQVLRFSRLFKPVHNHRLWKIPKKRKAEAPAVDDTSPSKTFKKSDDPTKKKSSANVPQVKVEAVAPLEAVAPSEASPTPAVGGECSQTGGVAEVFTYPPSSSDVGGGVEPVEVNGEKEEEKGEEEEEEVEEYCPIELNMGRDARPEELMPDDEVSTLYYYLSLSLSIQHVILLY